MSVLSSSVARNFNDVMVQNKHTRQQLLCFFVKLVHMGLCPLLFRTDDGMQSQFHVHIFKDGRLAVAVSLRSR